MELKEKDAVEFSLSSFEVFSDQRAKGIKFSAADPGSIVGYEYVQKHRPFVFEDDWQFQDEIPTRRARFSLQLPPGWEFSEYWANFPKQQPQSSANNFYVWEVENVPAVEVEPEMPPFLTIASRMDIKYFPRNPALRAKTTGSWNDIGVWYANLTSASRAPSPALQQKVTELTAGISDPLKKMQLLAAYVQQQIRYVAIEVGIGGLQPHPATDVFKHQYGDCKDKVTLLGAMLNQIGVDSYYVMIDTHRGIVNPDFPSLRGNHMIMAIRLPKEVTANTLYATVDDPQLGRLLFFDPTDEFVPLGYLPPELQQNYGLVITPDSGKLFLLPMLPPTTNRLLRTATLTLGPTGNLGGEVNELRWGAPAGDSRAQFVGSSPSDREKVVEKFLGAFLNNFTLTNATVGNLEKYDENFILHYQFVVEGYAKTAGNLLILRPRVVGEKGSNILAGKSRKYPIEFGGTTLQSDSLGPRRTVAGRSLGRPALRAPAGASHPLELAGFPAVPASPGSPPSAVRSGIASSGPAVNQLPACARYRIFGGASGLTLQPSSSAIFRLCRRPTSDLHRILHPSAVPAISLRLSSSFAFSDRPSYRPSTCAVDRVSNPAFELNLRISSSVASPALPSSRSATRAACRPSGLTFEFSLRLSPAAVVSGSAFGSISNLRRRLTLQRCL
jgi:hypothetical protein